MTEGIVPISDTQLLFSLGLILLTSLISAAFHLGLTRSLLWGTVRCVVQLTLVGYALVWIFSVDHPLFLALVVAFMSFMAALTATRRTPNVWDFPSALAFLAMVSSAYIVMVIVCALIIQPDPWYKSSVAIPIAGMILGNAVNGVALALDRLYAEVDSKRDEIESLLALGARPWEATSDAAREALRAGLTPTINSLMVVGLVSLPGMMTGQILGGVNPLDAIRYQIVVMFMITTAVAIGSILLIALSFRRLFTEDMALAVRSVESDQKRKT
jgi:putative ABC transport system permease protein